MEEPLAAAVIEFLNAALKIAAELREQLGFIRRDDPVPIVANPDEQIASLAIEQEQTHVALRLPGQSESQEHDFSKPFLTHLEFPRFYHRRKKAFQGDAPVLSRTRNADSQ